MESRLGSARDPGARVPAVLLCLLALPFSLAGCFDSSKDKEKDSGKVAVSGTVSTSGATANAATDYATGIKGVKIILKANGTDGSFDPPTTGQSTAPGIGYPVTRIFTTGGNLLANNSDPTQWPDGIKWLKSFEVSLSGTTNTGATSPDCARFAEAASDGVAQCDWDSDAGATTTSKPCGAPQGYYRVSEKDCVDGGSVITPGTGAATDPVFLRFTVDRTQTRIGAKENLMVIVEYAASNMRPASADPTRCYNTALNIFDPTDPDCADQSWQIYIKRAASDVVMPFLTLVPPSMGSIDVTNNRGGANVTSRQIFVPLAGDSTLKTVQLSRIKAKAPSAMGAAYEDVCPCVPGWPSLAACPATVPPVSGSNSALCLGMIYYSISILRI